MWLNWTRGGLAQNLVDRLAQAGQPLFLLVVVVVGRADGFPAPASDSQGGEQVSCRRDG
jgi:hypothetical protein